jgi:hypothetical protein
MCSKRRYKHVFLWQSGQTASVSCRFPAGSECVKTIIWHYCECLNIDKYLLNVINCRQQESVYGGWGGTGTGTWILFIILQINVFIAWHHAEFICQIKIIYYLSLLEKVSHGGYTVCY